jgi:cobalt-zinc-cadmium efflux system outer membrane protein
MPVPTIARHERGADRSPFGAGAACALGLLLVAAPALAAPLPALSLHLDDALSIARHRNLDLLLAAADTVISIAGIRTAREHPNPGISLISSRIHTDGGDASAAGNRLWSRVYDSVLSFGQEVELGGKRAARREAAAATADAAHARYADARRTVEAALVRTYAAAALAGAEERIARDSAGYLRDEARIAAVRWTAGDISRSDLEQIEIAAARLDLDAANAATTAHTQRIALEVLLGIPGNGGDIVVADSIETLVAGVPEPDTSAGAGLRPDLAAATAEVRRAEAAWRGAQAERIPDPTLVFQLEHQPPVRANTFGLGVALSLPLWNRNAGAIAAAGAEREKAAREMAQAQAVVSADLAAARGTFGESSRRWRRYRDELRPRSEAIRRSVSLAYEKGGASLVDLLEAQRNDNDVRLASMQAAYDAVVAAADLRAATTTITSEGHHP